ncbi:MAG TPA: hypothetical protein ENN80_02525, partial [Candidatus Hydrogenedentes bacterium]|nr:hypothetical protein [Candidatus Hydrogenedentota bacterium]
MRTKNRFQGWTMRVLVGALLAATGASADNDLALVTPNGGEAWGCGTRQTITWCNTSGDAGADVRLGLEKGEEFVDWIVRRTENDGAY